MFSIRGWARAPIYAGIVALVMSISPAASSLPAAEAEEPGNPRIASPDSAFSSFHSYDVTGDNWPDIVTRNRNTGVLSVHEHTGTVGFNSTFKAPSQVGTGWGMYNWIGVGNFVGSEAKDGTETADKGTDLGDLIGRTSDGTLIAYPHSGTYNGASTWLPPVTVGRGFGDMVRLWVADADSDGFDDIIASDFDNVIWVYPNNASSNLADMFTNRVRVSGGSNPFAGPEPWTFHGFASWYQDFPDFVSIRCDGGSSRYTPNNRTTDLGESSWGKWAGGGSARYFPESINCDTATLADVTGDGNDDIVTMERQFGELWLYPTQTERLHGVNRIDTNGVFLGSGWEVYDVIT